MNDPTGLPEGMKDPLTAGNVATLFGVDVKAVIRWDDTGRITGFRTPGGHRRYHWTHVRELLRDYRRPAPVPVKSHRPCSAKIHAGDGPGLDLHLTPVALRNGTPGLILGYTTNGKPVTLTAMRLGWLDDLESAIQACRAAAIVQGGMHPVPA